jgi:acyl-CoA thioester hydrolase
MKPHVFNFQIAYADTDAAGITYHGRYIEIAERARMNWKRDIMQPDGDIGFVVTKLKAKYIRPFKVGDMVRVETIAAKIGGASMDIEHKFFGDNGEMYALVNVIAAYIGDDFRPKRIPEEIIERISNY